ncbi:DUF1657 domain-containing protein [Calidifontibacillus erzurumensis]|uniref:DUF1657 domain-containing protein n=1 Tax=Calidifontibacillus erzurumensis TaxID=2741433 RepID=A0A8J8GFN4_9BACI|nr:DUF1657 domain-containing protein [Calidifontibacillus erzurumensis]NSL53070.1 DUF1657 domain-containing protein [Calidifontibacillus erzurumensis]
MTVASQVKQCTYTLKSVEQGLIHLSARTQKEETRKTIQEAASVLSEVVAELEKRVGELEWHEPQYKGL